MTTDMARRTRDVTGPTGYVFSNAWDKLEEHGDAYMKSFDEHLPPSLFVSERDRTRHNQAIPVLERCLGDHKERVAAVQRERTRINRPKADAGAETQSRI